LLGFFFDLFVIFWVSYWLALEVVHVLSDEVTWVDVERLLVVFLLVSGHLFVRVVRLVRILLLELGRLLHLRLCLLHLLLLGRRILFLALLVLV
jgi:hypothetical protein